MNKKRIALFGTSETTIGLAKKALERGHRVTVIIPDESKFSLYHSNLKIAYGDIKKKEDVFKYSKESDVVICVCDPTDFTPGEHADTTRAIIDALKDAGVKHLIYATHIELLSGIPKEFKEETQEGRHLKINPWNDWEQPTEFKSPEKAHKEAIKILQSEKGLNWGYAHAARMGNITEDGAKHEIRYTHPEGEKKIAANDYISSLIDEAEKEDKVEINNHDEGYNNKKRQL
jgi:putative NADH-flavin reductase